jgi:hypothetical protein
VPVGTGTAPVPADQAALTSIVLGVAARGAGTLTSSMPFAEFRLHMGVVDTTASATLIALSV